MDKEIIILLICAGYNLFILSLAVVMVGFYGWSAWWLLGAVLLFASPRSVKHDDE